MKLGGILCNIFTGNTTVCENISHCITTNTVRAMDTAGNFAGSIKTRDDIAVTVNDLSIGVDDPVFSPINIMKALDSTGL